MASCGCMDFLCRGFGVIVKGGEPRFGCFQRQAGEGQFSDSVTNVNVSSVVNIHFSSRNEYYPKGSVLCYLKQGAKKMTRLFTDVVNIVKHDEPIGWRSASLVLETLSNGVGVGHVGE